MDCEIRDLQSSETIRVPPEGLTFGREGSTADIKVPDRAVSGRHARVYKQGSQWLLEDLGSSNGTVVDNAKIEGPIQLRIGLEFRLCRYAFQVVALPGAEIAAGDWGKGVNSSLPPSELPTAALNAQEAMEKIKELPKEVQKASAEAAAAKSPAHQPTAEVVRPQPAAGIPDGGPPGKGSALGTWFGLILMVVSIAATVVFGLWWVQRDGGESARKGQHSQGAQGKKPKKIALTVLNEDDDGKGQSDAKPSGTQAAPPQGAGKTAKASGSGATSQQTTTEEENDAGAGDETSESNVGEAASELVEAPGDRAAYPEYARRRAAIEKAIDEDPTVLSKKAVRVLYKEYLFKRAKARWKHKVKPPKKPGPEHEAKVQLAERMAEIDAYRMTAALVDKLYEQLQP